MWNSLAASGRTERYDSHTRAQQTRRGGEPVSARPRRESGELAALGGGDPGGGPRAGQADLSVGGLRRLSLVSRDGGREFRRRGGRGGAQRGVRPDKGRPRGATRHRQHLPDSLPACQRPGWLAAIGVAHPGGGAVPGRHLLSAGATPRDAWLSGPAGGHRGGLERPRGAREDGEPRRTVDGDGRGGTRGGARQRRQPGRGAHRDGGRGGGPLGRPPGGRLGEWAEVPTDRSPAVARAGPKGDRARHVRGGAGRDTRRDGRRRYVRPRRWRVPPLRDRQ